MTCTFSPCVVKSFGRWASGAGHVRRASPECVIKLVMKQCGTSCWPCFSTGCALAVKPMGGDCRKACPSLARMCRCMEYRPGVHIASRDCCALTSNHGDKPRKMFTLYVIIISVATTYVLILLTVLYTQSHLRAPPGQRLQDRLCQRSHVIVHILCKDAAPGMLRGVWRQPQGCCETSKTEPPVEVVRA